MKIKLTDGTVITEKRETVNGFPCFGYYLGKEFVFGVQDRFEKEDLEQLNDNGYFDLEKEKVEKMTPRVKASLKYNEKNTKQVKLSLNLKTDADIIAWLSERDNVQGYIKRLIRDDMP